MNKRGDSNKACSWEFFLKKNKKNSMLIRDFRVLANMNEKNTQTGGMKPFEWQMTICNARRNSTSEICDLITYWMNLVD